jgi:PAS domain S-box-containing protein
MIRGRIKSSGLSSVFTIIALPLLTICCFLGCSPESWKKNAGIGAITSYRDIPGVTKDEINAIEALKSSRESFSFGTMLSTEAFILPDGAYAGFKPMLCDFLSGLFDIPFIPDLHLSNTLKSGIDNGTIDFTDGLTPVPERTGAYFMTDPIAYFTPVSLATANTELRPILSVINKYIEAGGIDKLYELYNEGNFVYSKYELSRILTDEEKDYLFNLAAKNEKVPIALEHDNYPISFYNDRDEKFQGIALDLLAEISLLTSIEFETVTDKTTPWSEIFEKLKLGEVSLVSELLYSEERSNDFLWPETPNASSHYALLSKIDYPNMEMYQVIRSVVGIVRDTVHDEMYNKWFPDNANTKYYDTQDKAMSALEKGDIDLIMESEFGFITLTNLHEKAGYKINILFGSPTLESFFGFSKNEKILCSIISKAQGFIDIQKIEKSWTSRVYDYSRKVANEKAAYLTVFTVILTALLIILINLLWRNNQTREKYKSQMTTLSAIYESLPDHVYCKDINGAYTSCNPSFEDHIGLSESEIIGKTPIDLFIDKKLAQEYVEIDRKVMAGKVVSKDEKWVTFIDKPRRLYEIIKAPLFRNGRVTGLLGIGRDITEHRAVLDKAYAASRAKGNFLAKMSHEIRTPMNAVIGMAELALREEDPDAARAHVHTIKQAGTNLLSIINDILDFSKIESGKFEIQPDYYLFGSLVNDVVSIIRMRAIDSQLRFVVNIDSNIPQELYGDETRIRQTLINILGNAVKYTDAGFIAFTITGEFTDKETVRLEIEIIDSGRGIRQENLKMLFKDFVQVDTASMKGIEGTGLGLAITWNIVKAMDGDIDVHSEYGKGSTFTVTLPQKFRAGEKVATVESPEKKSVLVYERRNIYADSIVCTIDNLGVRCELASTEEEFRERLGKGGYEYIFIASTLYEREKGLIRAQAAGSKVVLLTEFGEGVPGGGGNILAMPAHCISVANVLNGEADAYTYKEDGETFAGFTAPDARVLVVDDINTNLVVAEGLLLPYGMDVELCRSGTEAVEKATGKDYDLILMDHWMPEMDGVEAVARIREWEKGAGRSTPIIALTANAMAGSQDLFIGNGFNGFLAKPIDTVKLNAALEKWIPKEKKKNPAPRGVARKEENLKIEGVDTRKGIALSGGSLERYWEILEVFVKDMAEKVGEMKGALGAGDIGLYTIHVHALKSAIGNIGAVELSEAAKGLEGAGRQRDLEYIKKHGGAFMEAVGALAGEIEGKLEKRRGEESGKGSADLGELREGLKEQKEALEALDAGRMNSAIEALLKLKLPEAERTAVREISKNILIAEYENALNIIESLLKESL